MPKIIDFTEINPINIKQKDNLTLLIDQLHLSFDSNPNLHFYICKDNKGYVFDFNLKKSNNILSVKLYCSFLKNDLSNIKQEDLDRNLHGWASPFYLKVGNTNFKPIAIEAISHQKRLLDLMKKISDYHKLSMIQSIALINHIYEKFDSNTSKNNYVFSKEYIFHQERETIKSKINQQLLELKLYAELKENKKIMEKDLKEEINRLFTNLTDNQAESIINLLVPNPNYWSIDLRHNLAKFNEIWNHFRDISSELTLSDDFVFFTFMECCKKTIEK